MEFDMYKETSIDHGSSSDTVPRAEGSLEGPNLFLRMTLFREQKVLLKDLTSSFERRHHFLIQA
jgi:hypothetical protein